MTRGEVTTVCDPRYDFRVPHDVTCQARLVVMTDRRPNNMLVYLRDGSAQTILCAATLR